MICPRCGKTNIQGASYCGECGIKLPAEGTTMQGIQKKVEREADMAAKAAGDGLQSVIDDIVKIIK